ncbi:hypothetical protein [Deinococcus gobiensis]|uniref:Uncharacterized protein n=1 Tax=Deinococcus gobiensis (strain DSM 21396 / JCM 16679 / CGMCC 1.7299 / I-0) TaxID=745776 RepID=H8H1K8_DEIGI|nr:hypothetical protein [Deinococcus gobiensis]AFD27405.1 hypothetical protein DGo_PB0136 [Deinococcus gobiensis I-0]
MTPTLPHPTPTPLAWYVALTAPPRPGIDAWDNRVTVLLDGQVLTVTQGNGRHTTAVTLPPSFLGLTRELLDQRPDITHRVLVLDEHTITRQDCARVVYEARLPLTSPRAELSLLRPCAQQALSAGADGRWKPVQAAFLLNPPGYQPQLHIHQEALDTWA